MAQLESSVYRGRAGIIKKERGGKGKPSGLHFMNNKYNTVQPKLADKSKLT